MACPHLDVRRWLLVGGCEARGKVQVPRRRTTRACPFRRLLPPGIAGAAPATFRGARARETETWCSAGVQQLDRRPQGPRHGERRAAEDIPTHPRSRDRREPVARLVVAKRVIHHARSCTASADGTFAPAATAPKCAASTARAALASATLARPRKGSRQLELRARGSPKRGGRNGMQNSRSAYAEPSRRRRRCRLLKRSTAGALKYRDVAVALAGFGTARSANTIAGRMLGRPRFRDCASFCRAAPGHKRQMR